MYYLIIFFVTFISLIRISIQNADPETKEANKASEAPF